MNPAFSISPQDDAVATRDKATLEPHSFRCSALLISSAIVVSAQRTSCRRKIVVAVRLASFVKIHEYVSALFMPCTFAVVMFIRVLVVSQSWAEADASSSPDSI